MSTQNLTIVLAICVVVYFGITWFWMWMTLKHKNCINYYIFQKSLNKDKVDIMHYVERAMVILMLIGFLTTIVSQIQIIYHGGKENDKNRQNNDRTKK